MPEFVQSLKILYFICIFQVSHLYFDPWSQKTVSLQNNTLYLDYTLYIHFLKFGPSRVFSFLFYFISYISICCYQSQKQQGSVGLYVWARVDVLQ